MTSDRSILVCFAVHEESRHFRKPARLLPSCDVLVTGIGRRNAESSLARALSASTPRFVVSSGFAGGLNPQIKVGTVVFDAAPESPFLPVLRDAGAVAASFHGVERIASTSQSKQSLWKTTGADAVDMESAAIRGLCAKRNIPSATIRIISDAADEDLALDFNAVMTRDLEMDYLKLVWTLGRAPWIVPRLWRFRRRIDRIGANLADVLAKVVRTPLPQR